MSARDPMPRWSDLGHAMFSAPWPVWRVVTVAPGHWWAVPPESFAGVDAVRFRTHAEALAYALRMAGQ